MSLSRVMACVPVVALASACVYESPGDSPSPYLPADGGPREGPPHRIVTDGTLALSFEAPPAPEPGGPYVAPDAAVIAYPDAAAPDRAVDPPPAEAPRPGDGAALTCNLIAQDCPRAYACYPGPLGRGQCLLAGQIGLGGPCSVDEQCDRGMVCVPAMAGNFGTCQRLCMIGQACTGRQTCFPLPDQSAGYCGL